MHETSPFPAIHAKVFYLFFFTSLGTGVKAETSETPRSRPESITPSFHCHSHPPSSLTRCQAIPKCLVKPPTSPKNAKTRMNIDE
jgi:hypothetical protein